MPLRNAYPTLFAFPRHFRRFVTFRWWTWRMTRRFLFACAALATLVAVAYTIENFRGRRAFAAVVSEAAAAGLSFNLSETAQPPVPDDQNLAKIPLFDAPADTKLRDEFWRQLTARLNLQRKRSTAIPSSDSLPDVGWPLPSENRLTDLAAFRAAVDALETKRNTESLDIYLDRVAPLLDEIGAAAAARPYLHYDYDWGKPLEIGIPQVGPVRSLARAVALRSLIALEAERPAEAARMLALPLRLGSAYRRDTFLVTQISALAIDNLSTGPIWQGLIDHRWTQVELSLFSTLLADDQILASLRRAYAAEAAWGITILLQLPELAQRSGQSFSAIGIDWRSYPLGPWAPFGWLQQNAAILGRYYLDEVFPSLNLSAGRVYPHEFRRYDEHPAATFRPYEAIAQIVRPSLRPLLLTIGCGKTTRDLARLAVALEQHLLAHGAYPESLTPVLAADPALAALHDPFDGQPYRYRRETDGGFMLWGIGRNLRDDGGAFPEKKGERADFDTGDLVWRVPGR